MLWILLIAPMLCAGQSVVERADRLLQQDQAAPAEALLQAELARSPGDIEVRYRLGYAQYRLRKLAAARQNFQKIVNTAPPALFSRYFLGRIALAENRPAEAITWLEPVAASPETVFDAAAQLAGAYMAAGQPARSVAPLKRAIAQTPWDAPLYFRLGQALQKSGQPELAREALETSNRLRSTAREDVETLMDVSRALNASEGSAAMRLSARLLERDGADPNALVALGVLFGSANRHADALQAFAKAAASDPNSFQAQYNTGLSLMKSGRTADALVPLRRAVELLPQSDDANSALGLAAFTAGQHAEALAPLERAWRMDASNFRVGALLAMAYLRTDAGGKAVPVLEQMSKANPNDPSPRILLLQALVGSPRAVETALDMQKRFPADVQVQMAAGQTLAREGRYRDARPSFEAVLRARPDEPFASLGLAEAMQKSGEHAGAVPHYESAFREPKTELAARLGVARSYVALRKLDEARGVLEAALPAHGADATLHLDLSRVYARLGNNALAAEHAQQAEARRK